MSLDNPLDSELIRDATGLLRHAPQGYVAIQDSWADDFVIRTAPAERPTEPAVVDAQAARWQLYQILWVAAAIAVAFALAVVLIAG